MRETAKKPDRLLVVILGVIATLVVVALLVVFTRGEPVLRDASTPEGVVQRYSAAAIAGDETAAAEYLTDAAVDRCENFERGDTGSIRVTLVSTTERDDSADVRVSIVTFYGSDPFGGSESEYEDVFDLVKVDGDWKIDVAPWQLAVCPRG